MMNKMILTDVDGVLLNWNDAFEHFMHKHGHKKVIDGEYELGASYGLSEEKAHDYAIRFNESAYIGSLAPLKDAVKYVNKLHQEHGYVFHCITAIPNTPEVWKLRKENLDRLFGSAIYRLDCSGKSANKYRYLKEYENSGLPWVEDSNPMAELGNTLGLSSYLIDHDYNKHSDHPDIPRVKNWQELYSLFT